MVHVDLLPTSEAEFVGDPLPVSSRQRLASDSELRNRKPPEKIELLPSAVMRHQKDPLPSSSGLHSLQQRQEVEHPEIDLSSIVSQVFSTAGSAPKDLNSTRTITEIHGALDFVAWNAPDVLLSVEALQIARHEVARAAGVPEGDIQMTFDTPDAPLPKNELGLVTTSFMFEAPPNQSSSIISKVQTTCWQVLAARISENFTIKGLNCKGLSVTRFTAAASTDQVLGPLISKKPMPPWISEIRSGFNSSSVRAALLVLLFLIVSTTCACRWPKSIPEGTAESS